MRPQKPKLTATISFRLTDDDIERLHKNAGDRSTAVVAREFFLAGLAAMENAVAADSRGFSSSGRVGEPLPSRKPRQRVPEAKR